MINAVEVGNKSNGGFWAKPFADLKGAWNIKGSGRNSVYECGDNLDP